MSTFYDYTLSLKNYTISLINLQYCLKKGLELKKNTMWYMLDKLILLNLILNLITKKEPNVQKINIDLELNE